ncbi:selenoneine biosynthesis selenosugar synthase SenB [Aestuariirhabdus litorea]|uniref:TIGR04348 family glycosyltransferase n=1 Tax=Aestuariirhabdus litorea TaxID=2528527 RepID=A0A3P3VJH4_9GAMM|nr:selenoneine biosynthesis selenosugar synthase SenB [Aestuariirhabdus litorea]RRJ82842.1 TIGR04348 family glycosyltransferase [Aestuariirhabdus litorea]RWW93001.1 TIGR04348 family glycosyltransferase [Endozoicomonadaceae bacterium GTF-13]
MRIILITPAPLRSRAGNRTTAARWAHLLRSLGHRVEVATRYEGQAAELMIALHAWRSADSVVAFRARYPDRPLVVAITGTDAYRFIHSDPEVTLRSLALADRLVGLHDRIAEALPADVRHKLQVIYQSAEPVSRRQPYTRYFHVAVMGHLREEKDPLRPALAARLLPASSHIQIHQYGKAHSPEWADQARAEMAINPRYHWHGECPHYQVRRVYQRTHLLLLPSRMEGGANVISEAVVAGVPVIASDIEGSKGLLGESYPGYYPVGDEKALSTLLLRVESDPTFYRSLQRAGQAIRGRFTQAGEARAWQRLLGQLDAGA